MISLPSRGKADNGPLQRSLKGTCTAQLTVTGLQRKTWLSGHDLLMCTFFHCIDDIFLTELGKAVLQVLSHLKSCGWAVKEAKLQRPGLPVKFLGIVWLGKTEIIPHVVIDKIQAYRTLTTVKELQTFWGPLGHWRAFLPHFAQVFHPLYSLVKKGVNWYWTPTSEQVFQGATCIIKGAQALHALDPARPCEQMGM